MAVVFPPAYSLEPDPMGDLKKVARIVIPILFFAISGGVGCFSGGFLGWLGGQSALQGLAYGLGLSNLLFGEKTDKSAERQQTYGLGPPTNAPRPNEPIGVLYGKRRLYGSTIYNNQKSTQEADRIIVLCEGEVDSISDIRLNNYLMEEWTDCSADAYTGTTTQVNDSRFDAGHGTLKGLAYLACTIKSNEHMKSSPVMSALVKGLKVQVYNGASWTTEWSENPSFVIQDIMTRFCNISTGNINRTNTWWDFAQACDATIPGQYDCGDNLALAGTITGTGVNNPSQGNDGHLLPDAVAQNWMWWDAPQSETLAEGPKLDLGAVYLIKRFHFHYFDADGRVFYNWKVTYSADGVTYYDAADMTASGRNYQGRQDIIFDTPVSARYFKIYSSGSDDSAYAVVKEMQAYEAVPSKRYTVSALLNRNRKAYQEINDILTMCDAWIYKRRGLWEIGWNHSGLTSVADFDSSNVHPGSFSVVDRPLRDKPNKLIVKYVNPFSGWQMDDVFDNDQMSQDDDGERKQEIGFEYMTRESQALRITNRLAKMNRRTPKTCSLKTGMKDCQVMQGSLFTYTDEDFGYDGKLWQASQVTEYADGSREIQGTEWFANIYNDGAAVTTESRTQQPLRNPLEYFVQQVTGVSVSETNAQPGDGTWIPAVSVTWTNPDDDWWDHCLVEISSDGGSTYRTVSGPIRDGVYLHIGELEPGATYYFRVRSVSEYNNVKAPAGAAPYDSLTIAGKDVAPSDVSGFNFDYVGTGIEVRWTGISDKDLAYYQVRDGAVWGSASELFKTKSTKHVFNPTKRQYDLKIKAFDLSGNESATAGTTSINKVAPDMGSVTPVATAYPGRIEVEFDPLANIQVKNYIVHVSTSSGFTCVAGTAKGSASLMKYGKQRFTFPTEDGVTYYIRVCAEDSLSYLLGDQYSYPSIQASATGRLTETGDFSTIVLVGAGGGGMPSIKLVDGSLNVCSWIGDIEVDGNPYFGAYHQSYLGVGDDQSDPDLEFISGGPLRLKDGVLVGDSSTTDLILSTKAGLGNICYNGGFEACKKIDAWGSDVDFIPGWKCYAVDTGGNIQVIQRSSYGVGYTTNGDRAVRLTSTTSGTVYLNTIKTRISPSTEYQFSIDVRTSAAIDIQMTASWKDKDGAAISSTTLVNDSFNASSMTRYSYGATAPATAAYVQFQVYPAKASSGTIYVYIDSVQIERGVNATAYSDADLAGTRQPVGCFMDPENGFSVFNNTPELVCRMGNLGGLYVDGSPLPANTMGFYGFAMYLVDPTTKDSIVTVDGVNGEYIFADSVVEDAIAPALLAWILSSGATNEDAPHDDHIAIISRGTISLTATWPVAVAHGQASAPEVIGKFRGCDSGDTDAYSEWTMFGHPLQYAPGSFVNDVLSYITADDTYIYFHIKTNWNDGATGINEYFSSSYKQYFYLPDDSSTPSSDNIWDELEVEYEILRT